MSCKKHTHSQPNVHVKNAMLKMFGQAKEINV